MSKKRLVNDLKTMYTTISGLPDGAKVFEVMNWHEDEPTPTPEQLAVFRRQVRERNNW